jgi:hypothetical protein
VCNHGEGHPGLTTGVAHRFRTECTLRINGDQASLKKTMTTEVRGMASKSKWTLLHSGILYERCESGLVSIAIDDDTDNSTASKTNVTRVE